MQRGWRMKEGPEGRCGADPYKKETRERSWSEQVDRVLSVPLLSSSPLQDSGRAEHYNLVRVPLSFTLLSLSFPPLLPSLTLPLPLLSLCLFSLSLLLSLSLSLSLLLSHSFFSPQATLASCTLPSYPPRSITTRCRDTRAPLLASKTVLDPRATLHTIRERHGEAPLLSDSPSCSARGHHWRHKAHCSTASVVTKRGLSWFHSGSRLIITKRFCSQEIDEFSGTRQRLLFISSQNNW